MQDGKWEGHIGNGDMDGQYGEFWDSVGSNQHGASVSGIVEPRACI